MITAIAGLEEGKIEPNTIIRDLGRYTFWTDVNPAPVLDLPAVRQTHGPVNVTKAIEVSCNYFFYDVGRQVGIDTLDEYAAMFGLGQKTGVELYEEAGVVGGREFTESLGQTWYEGSVTSVASARRAPRSPPSSSPTISPPW